MTRDMSMNGFYHLAQRAMADLKAAVYVVLEGATAEGLTNAEIGRNLGIYAGHIEHEGHISRTLLALMEKEGVVQQIPSSKRWILRRHGPVNAKPQAVDLEEVVGTDIHQAKIGDHVGNHNVQPDRRDFPRTIASAPKGEKTDITVTLRWDLLDKGQPETIREKSAAATMGKLLARICDVEGDRVLPELCQLKTGSRILVSQHPDQDFINQNTGEIYRHHKIGETGFFILTQTDTERKIECLSNLLKRLDLPARFLEIVQNERTAKGN